MTSAAILESLWRASWQGGLALAAAWGMTRLLRRGSFRISARAGVWVWRLAYIKLLTGLMSSAVALPVLGTRFVTGAPPDVMLRLQQLGGAAAATVPASVGSSTAAHILVCLWALGVAVAALRTVTAVRASQRMVLACEPVHQRSLLWTYRRLGLAMGISRMPSLLLGDVEAPVLVGLLRQSIILPRRLTTHRRSNEDLSAMLAHELAHVGRADILWNCLLWAASCLFFFHPMARIGWAECCLLQEIECDRVAMDATGHGSAVYAKMLIVVSATGSGKQAAFATAFAAPQASLRSRLEALKGIRRSVGVALLSAACVVALVVWTSPIRLTYREIVVPAVPSGLSADAALSHRPAMRGFTRGPIALRRSGELAHVQRPSSSVGRSYARVRFLRHMGALSAAGPDARRVRPLLVLALVRGARAALRGVGLSPVFPTHRPLGVMLASRAGF